MTEQSGCSLVKRRTDGQTLSPSPSEEGTPGGCSLTDEEARGGEVGYRPQTSWLLERELALRPALCLMLSPVLPPAPLALHTSC